MRNSFPFHLKFKKQFVKLTGGQAKALVLALCDYAATGKYKEIDPVTDMAFCCIQDQMDYDEAQYRKKCEKNRESARKRWNADACTPMHTDADTGYDTGYDTGDVNNKNNSKVSGKGNTNKKFAVPTIEEIEAACREKGYGVDAGKFWDFYESKGWMVGKNSMKDWRAALRNWERNALKNGYKDKRKEFVQHGYTAEQRKRQNAAAVDELEEIAGEGSVNR